MASITDQNWVVWNQGKNPLVNFNFMLRVEMLFDLPCKSVRAFERELEYDFIQEGGLNDYVHMRRKPISKPFTLEVERYVGVDYIDPMPLGADLVLPLMLFVSRNHDQFIPFVVARTYVFTGCTVMKKTYGDLVADQSGLLVETTTIGYREMLCVDIPWSEVGDNIHGSVSTNPARPTDAKTQDKSGDSYKALAQQLYEQAKAAKERCDDEFKEADVDKLLSELEDIIDRLEKHAGDNGPLKKAVADAEAGLKDADGKDRAKTVSELQTKARTAKRELQEKEAAKADADDALALAQLTEDQLTEKKQTLTQMLAPINAYLEKNNAPFTLLDMEATGIDVSLLVPSAGNDLLIAAPERPTQSASTAPSPAPKQKVSPPVSPAEIRAQAETAKKRLEDELKAVEDELKAAKEETTAAKEAVLEADDAVKEAQKALLAAENKAAKAARDLSLAQGRLSDAESDLRKAKEQLTRLQSQQTNLELRKDRAVSSQKSCGEDFKKCEEENTKVQAMTDEHEIYIGYQAVESLTRSTNYHERQVRDAAQYMESTEKLIQDTEAMLPDAAAESSEDTETTADGSTESDTENDTGSADTTADDGNADTTADDGSADTAADDGSADTAADDGSADTAADDGSGTGSDTGANNSNP